MKHTAANSTPSLKWHLICVGICVAAAAVLLGALSWLSTHLPAPYAPRTPAHDTTPWND